MNRVRVLRAALRRKSPTPLGAIARGLLAGTAGAAAQSLFFRATQRWAPKPTKLPPEETKPEGDDVSALHALATRVGEGVLKRPMTDEQKSRAATAVHYLFGAGWGAVYALCRESFGRVSPVLFGGAVWVASDNLLLPAFRLAAWPTRYSLQEHHYAVQAHAAFGLATAGTYAVLRDLGPLPLTTIPAMIGLQAWAFLLRSPPARLFRRGQSWPRRVVQGTLVQKLALA
jgi:hypothetical protein